MVDSADQPDSNRFHTCAADLSSVFSTCLASSFVHHSNDIEPFSLCPGGTDCPQHDGWENLTTRGARTNRREDRWRTIICRGADQSHSGIRASEGREWALRTCRVVLYAHHSCHTPRFTDGTS